MSQDTINLASTNVASVGSAISYSLPEMISTEFVFRSEALLQEHSTDFSDAIDLPALSGLWILGRAYMTAVRKVVVKGFLAVSGRSHLRW